MEVKLRFFNYETYKKGIVVENDDYGIAAWCMEEPLRKLFLSNPHLTDYSKPFLSLAIADGIVAGRGICFPTLIKIDNEFFAAKGGSSLAVEERYWHDAVGMDIVACGLTNVVWDYDLSAGISKMAWPLYKAIRFARLSFPLLWQPRHSSFLVKKMGLKGFPMKAVSFCADLVLRPFIAVCNLRSKCLSRRFVVEELATVPDWVDSIVLDDGHKYMEVHDHRWMQWVLENRFSSNPRDSQHFFAIFAKDDRRPLGFFMTKERNKSLPEHHIDNVCFGSVIEWGTVDEGLLNEAQINKIALSHFSKSVDIAEIATADDAVLKRLKRLGFVRHGDATIVFKDHTKVHKDANDISLWRVRLGYADTPFY